VVGKGREGRGLSDSLTRGFAVPAQVDLSDVKAFVLDEVDVLFLDESFELEPIGQAAPQDSQFLFVTATLPVTVANQVSLAGKMVGGRFTGCDDG
jgi:superfamily II DNA/RNA helicase